MHQDGGDDLGMLAFNQFRHRWRIYPLEALDSAGIAAFQNTADVVGRFVVAQCFLKYRAGVIFRIEVQEKVLLRGAAQKSVDHGINLLPAEILEFGHRRADFLHFAGE